MGKCIAHNLTNVVVLVMITIFLTVMRIVFLIQTVQILILHILILLSILLVSIFVITFFLICFTLTEFSSWKMVCFAGTCTTTLTHTTTNSTTASGAASTLDRMGKRPPPLVTIPELWDPAVLVCILSPSPLFVGLRMSPNYVLNHSTFSWG